MTCPRPDKDAHRSFRAAIKARDSLEAERGIDIALRPYRCVCGAWHLGHRTKTPKWMRRKAKR
jgi:hypothetical protein